MTRAEIRRAVREDIDPYSRCLDIVRAATNEALRSQAMSEGETENIATMQSLFSETCDPDWHWEEID